MAEVVSAVASIVTIASLAKPAARLLRTMRKIAKDSDHIAKEIEIIAAQVEMTSASLDIALQQLKGHCNTIQRIRETPSEVLGYIVKNNLTDSIVRGSQGIRRHMKDVRSQLSSLGGGSRFIKDLKWYMWAKMEVQSLLPQFELVKTSLCLICPIINLEITLHHSQTLGERAAHLFMPEIESLKNQLRMSEQNYQRVMASETFCDKLHSSSHGAFEKSLAPLLRLSETMRTSETIPKTRSPTMARVAISSRYRSGSPVSDSTCFNDSTFPQSRTSPRSRASESSHGSMTPPRPSTPLTPVIPVIPSPSVCSSSSSVSTRPRITVNSQRICRTCKNPRLRTAPASEKSDMFQNSTEQEEPGTSPTSPTSSTSSMSTSSRPTLLPELKDQGHQQITRGRLRTFPGGHVSKPLLTLVDPSESYNIISLKTARELNLDVVELESEDIKSLSRHGARRIMGKIVDTEWQLERWTKAVKLELWVEDTYQWRGYDILLGKEFADLKSQKDR